MRGERVELPARRRLDGVLGVGREHRRVVLDLRRQVAALGALVLHAERHLEATQDEQRDPEVAEQQPPGHGTRSRKPTPRTVSIQPGSPSLRRSAATWTSIVFEEPYQLVCQTSSSSRCRLTAAPGSRASAASSSNSFGVSSSSRPSRVARRARSSTSSPPTRSGPSRPAERRRAPHDRADPGDQLAQPERLDDVVVGAELEPDDAVGLLAAGGHDDDRDARALAQLPADVEAVDVRQAQVEQDEVRGRGRRGRLSPVATRATSKPSRRSPATSGSAIASSSSTTRMCTFRVSCRPEPARHPDLAEPLLRLVGSFADGSPGPHPERPTVGDMNKAHVTLFALLVAGATVLGAVAVTRTTGLGRAARHTNDAAIAARTKQLASYAAKLQKELKAKPPALPPVPKPAPAVASAAAPAAVPAPQPAPRIVYHRPPPVVTVVHTHHGDDGSHESDGGGGGGGDD